MTAEALIAEFQALGVELIADPERDKIKIRPPGIVPPEMKERLRARKAEVLVALTNSAVRIRSDVFRQQLVAWVASARVGTPVLALPDAPPPQLGHCISCGEPLPPDRAWRCALCLEAVNLALAEGTR